MTLSITGGSIVDFTQPEESHSDLVTCHFQTGWRNLIDTQNERGQR